MLAHSFCVRFVKQRDEADMLGNAHAFHGTGGGSDFANGGHGGMRRLRCPKKDSSALIAPGSR